MKNELKIISIIGVAAVLAGCASTPADPGLTSYIEVDTAMSAMAANYIDADGNALGGVDASVTPWLDVPDNATATYNGFVGGDITGGALGGLNLVGELELTANFGANSISGSADNFYDSDFVQYSGTLDLDGIINRDAPLNISQLSATLDGNLLDGVDPDYDVLIALEGDFIGATYDAVGGYADGDVGTGNILGVFIAER